MAKGKSIDDYREKRDFERTPEPPPSKKKKKGESVFVVHRHDARRLHYDLRVEMEGVLRSWAVPKGFSYDSKDKHLAIRTEDHPLEYEHFHGVIPRGQYGAGTMTIWDHGTYRTKGDASAPSAVEKGELKIILQGRRLRGEWHLVKTKGGDNHWLLFKSRDRYSGLKRDSVLGSDIAKALQRDMPKRVKPMEAKASVEAFSDPAWVFELCLAGRRLFASKEGDEVKLRGLRKRIAGVEADLGQVGAENALFDGVLVALDESERPDADLLELCLAGKAEAPLSYYAFDLLYFDEFDLRPLRLVDRKGALRIVVPPLEHFLYVDHVPGNGESLVEAVREAGLGAVVAKRADSTYAPGPSDNWCTIPVEAKAGANALPVMEALTKSRKKRRAKVRSRYSNLDKVYWPAEGYTKGDLIAYYESVSEFLLPYLKDRPVHMNRFPDGIEGKSFYQRQAKEDTPDWVETIQIESDTHEGEIPQIICNDHATLMYLVNLGSIDLHPWFSRKGSLDSPDWALIDLDPKEAPFTDVIKIARETGRILHEVGLRPVIKTSGKTGLHIVVPLEPGYTYDHARMFCEGVARLVVRNLKDIATVERVIGNREGKVYVDFGQNRRGQTAVPPYVPRPVRGATVSTPLSWDELESDLHPSHFTILTVPDRLAHLGDLYGPALTDPQSLLPAIEAMQEWMTES